MQPLRLTYSAPDAALARELEKSLEVTLKDKFMNWRRTVRTQWNRHCTAVLRNSLLVFEANQGGFGSGSSKIGDDLSDRMRDLVGAYELFGFPLHFTYSDDDKIEQGLFDTRVHERDGPELEFALATHVHPYPSGLFSVWVYIACLTSKK